MSTKSEACPSENDVAELAAGVLTGARRARLEGHIDQCDGCRALLAEAVASVRAASASVAPPLPVSSSSPFLEPGRALGRYVVRALLGRGGMGAVYRAEDTMLRREVALKVIRKTDAGPDMLGRWRREVRAAAALVHPNIVAIYDVGETPEHAYFAMELVEGKMLRWFVGSSDVPIARRIAWLEALARALGEAHACGLVHRDIKPENVMVREDGSCKLLDFGLARWVSARPDAAESVETMSREDRVVGTPAYMAPEQVRGEVVDGRTDQFAWGVLAYELLTGRRPWARDAGRYALAAEILLREPARFASIAGARLERVEAVVLRALRKARAERFATMADVVAALEAARAPLMRPRGGAARQALALGAALTVCLICAGPPLPRATTPAATRVVARLGDGMSEIPRDVSPPAIAPKIEPRAQPASITASAPASPRAKPPGAGHLRLKDLRAIE